MGEGTIRRVGFHRLQLRLSLDLIGSGWREALLVVKFSVSNDGLEVLTTAWACQVKRFAYHLHVLRYLHLHPRIFCLDARAHLVDSPLGI